MRRWIGLENYKTYGYVPADLELTSVSKTLEYAYDDWCLSAMATMLDEDEVARKYLERSRAYRHVYDPSSGFMRGRHTDGSWSTPFHPRRSEHWMDDYAEGTAWQWTFFVPHDVTGLAQLMGGRDRFIQKLDSLFLVTAEVKGSRPSTDIVGGIGQYAHGNEVVHQVIYMYNLVDQPWKTQEKAREIMERYYRNAPAAYTGNEDTGQMASWFVWNAMGLFPYTHGDGRYAISSPLFDRVHIKMGDGPEAPSLLIVAGNNSPENKYVQELYLNGKPYRQSMILHKDLLNAELRFVMGPEPADWFN
jgi:predicted alpha-1,2-mannosidase